MAREKGFTGAKSLFWFAIRKPVYCGKIFVPKYRNESSTFVKEVNDPLISEDLYYRVQDVMDGRKRNQYRLKVVSNSTLPLRGFLTCPTCGKILTGSASKGHTKHNSYYHCSLGCKFRHRADDLNQDQVKFLGGVGFCSFFTRKKIGEIERAGGLSKVIVSQRDC